MTNLMENPMGTAEKLAELAKKHGRPMMCAKAKDGSWVIYITPDAQDRMGLMLQASLEIERYSEERKSEGKSATE